jgi:hypothetical protein
MFYNVAPKLGNEYGRSAPAKTGPRSETEFTLFELELLAQAFEVPITDFLGQFH